MTDTETTVKQVESFSPYGNTGEDYYLNDNWNNGKRAAKKDANTGDTTANPQLKDQNPERHQAWQEGYEGTGLSIHAFTHPVPGEDDGVFIMPDTVTFEVEGGSTKTHAAMVWAYDAYADKQDPKVRPLWAGFPVTARCIKLADGHAWSAGRRWTTDPGIRGTKMIDLPCPPYQYENEGHQMTIMAGGYKKSGTKAEFEAFIEELQGEVEEMSEGIDVSDSYLRATGSVTQSFSVNVAVSDLLDGDERMQDGYWLGDEDDLSEAAAEVFEEDPSEYISGEDIDEYGGYDDVYISESYVD